MYDKIIDALQLAKKAITKINNTLCRGVLNSITSGNVPTANVSGFDAETIDGIEFAQEWGFISSPPVDGNTELLMAFIRGHRDHGTILKSFNRTYSFKKLTGIDLIEGETVIYCKKANNYIYLKQDGTILINHHTGTKLQFNDDNSFEIDHAIAGTFLKFNTDGSITISSTSKSITLDTPTVHMTGNLTVDKDILDSAAAPTSNTDNVRGMRGIFNAHVHSGVSTGAGNTGSPTTQQ